MKWLSDEDLVDRVCEGDSDAFEIIYRRRYEFVYKYKEQFEKLSQEIEKLRQENAELKAEFKKQFVNPQPILPKEGMKPSSLYTPQESPSPPSKAVYTPSL